MKEFIDKLIERLEEYEQERLKMYDWQGQSATSDAIVIIKDIADEYRTCYKSCTECEAYNKEKHYCPKWCDVIKHTTSELAEEYKVSEMPTGWIPCSSGYFSTSEVLVCKEDGTIDFDVYDFMDNDWKFNSNHHKNKVIAWQPLPAPYTEGE